MTTVFTMPSAVIIPRFMPASKASEPAAGKTEDSLGFFNDGELDFDLLADYLLEEAESTEFGPPLTDQNFSLVTPPTSNASDLNFADPLADDTFQITYPLAQQQAKPAPIIAVADVVHNPPPPIAAPPPLAGMTGPPSLQGIALTPVPTTTPAMIVHHHKRQRIEPPARTNTINPQMQSTTIKPMTRAPAAPAVPVSAPRAYTNSSPAAPAALTGMHMMNNEIFEQRSGRQKSQAQIDRRRERNRILARRTRLRKKFFFESLQKEVTDLQKENMVLKELVRTHVEEKKAEVILNDCKANEELPQVVLEHCGDPSALARQDFNLMASVKQSQEAFVITDPSLHDNPIVYASDGFLDLSGYSREQVLGRNCRFLQGADTDQGKVAEIRKALLNGDDVSVTFLNYCADGTPFWNKLFIAALRDAQNNIVNYIGVSVKVAGDRAHDPSQASEGANFYEQQDDYLADNNGNAPVDFDATVMAIEGAVTAAVAAAPNVVKKIVQPVP